MTSLRTILVVGLGNPGPALATTRHNVGLMFLDYLSNSLKLQWSSKNRDCQASFAEWRSADTQLILTRPHVFMNESGKCVLPSMRHFRVGADQLFVVHDDLGREVGKFSPKLGGSASGHNGVKSIINVLRTDQFQRLRIGIGRPEEKTEVPSYVLESFSASQQTVLHKQVFPGCWKVLCDTMKIRV
eukprot:TRINITY_DN2020_c0_g1_i2.p1 TRINITY_DN2020_c0_g1~~TRINITY_DN2020_c0_g1_i2.p1  ORF type:complete len:186 (-),score=15.77 TRINITY_DN2020_c0_g1_i2:41-598(-)